jgi:cytochrome c-type biogenesis protein CcmE
VKKQSKFLAAGGLMAITVGYLMVSGMRDSMLYYYTPAELVAKTTSDPSVHDMAVKVGARVSPGTVRFDARTLALSFEVFDIQEGGTRFPVRYVGPLPDTFEEGRDVVVEGRFTEQGVFEATTVLTKCGSRYEAVEEDFRT